MKSIIVYSSLTGNTKKLAESIRNDVYNDTVFASVDEVTEINNYDLIILCYWVDKGTCDGKTLKLIEKIENKKIIAMGTLGAYPDSDHAKKCKENVKVAINEHNEHLGSFLCQGKIDERLIERFKSLPADHPHAITEEKIKRYKEASKHPNEQDFKNAREFVKNIIERN
ncbi:flavodoxin family protein [Clostridiaceae bacterium M8S5]|nr:flavodoxin family protein [Clostridiaceae bacterium M8S5]